MPIERLNGGGGINSLSAELPVWIDNTDPVNPIVNVFSSYYDVGDPAVWPYATIAAAIAQAVADGNANAGIRIHQNMIEDVVLPRGMSLQALLQNGRPIHTLTGNLSFSAGVGNAVVLGLTLIGNGVDEIITANVNANAIMQNCLMVQAADLPTVVSTAGSNLIIKDSSMFHLAATAACFDIADGNIVIQNTGADGSAPNLVAVIDGGALTAEDESILEGRVVLTTTGRIAADSSLFATASGSCIEHTSAATSSLINCTMSSNSGVDPVLSGTGTFQYSNLVFTNTQQGISSTVQMNPYRVVAPTIGAIQTLDVADDIAVTGSCKVRVVGNGGPVTLTSIPTLFGQVFDGDIITIIGTDDTNTVTLQDEATLPGSLLNLTNGISMTLGANDNITLMYNLAQNEYQELFRNDLAP